jgi:hypothetical protein
MRHRLIWPEAITRNFSTLKSGLLKLVHFISFKLMTTPCVCHNSFRAQRNRDRARLHHHRLSTRHTPPKKSVASLRRGLFVHIPVKSDPGSNDPIGPAVGWSLMLKCLGLSASFAWGMISFDGNNMLQLAGREFCSSCSSHCLSAL